MEPQEPPQFHTLLLLCCEVLFGGPCPQVNQLSIQCALAMHPSVNRVYCNRETKIYMIKQSKKIKWFSTRFFMFEEAERQFGVILCFFIQISKFKVVGCLEDR